MSTDSPFLLVPCDDWIASNEFAFAMFDGFPVTAGHTLVVTKRVVPSWFDASADEQAALIALVNEVRDILVDRLDPKPDGFNVGFNSGLAAGQTVAHVHIHVIPRYHGDVPDPRGGVRNVIPGKGNYLRRNSGSGTPGTISNLQLSTGYPQNPLWPHLETRLFGATEIDILASFVQPSGLDVIQDCLFAAVRTGANVRILIGDYLFITSPDALHRLLAWMETTTLDPADGKLSVRLAEMLHLNSSPHSFHPKAWRVADESGGMIVVGSSNLSRPALLTGVEWNLFGNTAINDAGQSELLNAFLELWHQATPIDQPLIERYALQWAIARKSQIEPESIDEIAAIKQPRPWQAEALQELARLRKDGNRRALIAVATGLGKTWLAAFDALQFGVVTNSRPTVLVVAHRAEILVQAEATFRNAMDHAWPETKVSWYLGAENNLSGDLVIASVQKLSRKEGVAELERRHFDYAVIDEVHHAAAPSYRRILAHLNATFVLGLTATPERTDGVDIANLFDDVLAWQATIGDGIEEGSLVPFHYIGLRDNVDFQQIPWRSGRFDPTILEAKVQNSERMESLWDAWQCNPCSRSLVFCCSQRHALFVKEWLATKGVRAAAVFAGPGSDPRAASLTAFKTGELDALCVVDLFNEGLDLPFVDRVIFLRPTESKVIFIQQLGRGLRAADGKTRLMVIDFVGNHRVFASRMLHLLSLSGADAGWNDLKRWVDGEEPDLPPGCLLDVELEAKDILRRFLPAGGAAAIEGYRALRDDLERRPTLNELFHRGYLPTTIRARHGDWFSFVKDEDDLNPAEVEVHKTFRDWLQTIEITALNRSYKMIVLRVLLDLEGFWQPFSIERFAAACRDYLLHHPVLNADLPPTKDFPDHAKAALSQWAKWWLAWPVGRWLEPQNGRTWFRKEGDSFRSVIECPESLREVFERLTGEIVDYRLTQYAKSRLIESSKSSSGEFSARVTHPAGRPILMLPTVEDCPSRPTGPTEVVLPDGAVWIFKFVRIACNVAFPKGKEGNAIDELMRGWFGADAGLPGTGFRVTFKKNESGWTITPSTAPKAIVQRVKEEAGPAPEKSPVCTLELTDNPPENQRFVNFVPVYDLEAAAGSWGPESSPREIGWSKIPSGKLKSGMFVAFVRGHSMEPKIPNGSWCLFQKLFGSREGKTILVQFNSLGDPESGGRYTVKQYQSVKVVSEESWKHERIQLRPLNPAFAAIEVTQDEAENMLVVGEFVSVIG